MHKWPHQCRQGQESGSGQVATADAFLFCFTESVTLFSMQLEGIGTSCNVTLVAPRRMKSPVYLYYELENYYQNHRRWVQTVASCQCVHCAPFEAQLCSSICSSCHIYAQRKHAMLTSATCPTSTNTWSMALLKLHLKLAWLRITVQLTHIPHSSGGDPARPTCAVSICCCVSCNSYRPSYLLSLQHLHVKCIKL